MGNFCSGGSPTTNTNRPKIHSRRTSNSGQQLSHSSNRWSRIRSSSTRKDTTDIDPNQALAAAILYHQQHQQHQQQGAGASLPFDRSASLRYPTTKKQQQLQGLPRSCSSRARSLTDPLLHPHQLAPRPPNQELNLDDLETKQVVLIHGGGFGAWCWYKTIALLEDDGFQVTAIDLTGSGIHTTDPNAVTSLAQYVAPLTDFLERLINGEKVILVGHDFGGACISYAMELFPSKIAKAIFIAAAMLTSGQSILHMFSHKVGSNELIQQAQVFLYANGRGLPPSAIDLDKSLLRELLFNQSPTKDVALASVSIRPVPFAPAVESLTLSDANYGSIRRFYIKTPEDNTIPIALQENIIDSSPPEQVYVIKGADHAPFFSKPQALHKILLEISRIPQLEK